MREKERLKTIYTLCETAQNYLFMAMTKRLDKDEALRKADILLLMVSYIKNCFDKNIYCLDEERKG